MFFCFLGLGFGLVFWFGLFFATRELEGEQIKLENEKVESFPMSSVHHIRPGCQCARVPKSGWTGLCSGWVRTDPPPPPPVLASTPGGRRQSTRRGESSERQRAGAREAMETGGDDPRGPYPAPCPGCARTWWGSCSSRQLLNAELPSALPFLLPARPAASPRSPRPSPSGGGAADRGPVV